MSNQNISFNRLTNIVKSWLPVIITTIGIITGYFVFKADTRNQFVLHNQRIELLEKTVEKNEKQLEKIKEHNIAQEIKIHYLENKISTQ